MLRNIIIIAIAVIVIALPFIFRTTDDVAIDENALELVVISPHNEAIRYEFAHGFSEWHREHYGRAVNVDWRVIGGTSEIMRYLAAEYVSAFKAWWTATGGEWPRGGASMMLDRKFKPEPVPEDVQKDPARLDEWQLKAKLHKAFRSEDDPAQYTCKIDLFFGGGTYDHNKAARQGLSVEPWTNGAYPENLFVLGDGTELIPPKKSGETWWTPSFFGNALSTFGICYNRDRLDDLGVELPPRRWEDLADPRYFGELGMADPTKSGSTAKAFEMIIHEQCHIAVREAGFSRQQVADYENLMLAARLPPGEVPAGVPAAYQEAVETGWRKGLILIQRLGANARYFTDGAGKVPVDVSMGNAAAGLAIDFYGRYQAEVSRAPDGSERMEYITPVGGSSVSADPISLLRGAENREVAVRFIEYVLSEEGQKLWNYKPGTPGGPIKFALRRLPVRREFYPSDHQLLQQRFEEHDQYTVDPLGSPQVNPYALADRFEYHFRWTAHHFSIHRNLIKAMCLDSAEELKEAWQTILENGGPAAQPEAMALMARLPDVPEPLTWPAALSVGKQVDHMDMMRMWTVFFRKSYREARDHVLKREGTTTEGARL